LRQAKAAPAASTEAVFQNLSRLAFPETAW
jgi:hypothetical protein